MASLRHADELNEGWDLNKVVFFKSELLDVQPVSEIYLSLFTISHSLLFPTCSIIHIYIYIYIVTLSTEEMKA